MSNLAIFSNESFGNVRTTMIDGNPWFVARDVCDCLGLDSSNISKLLDEDEKGVVYCTYPLVATRGC